MCAKVEGFKNMCLFGEDLYKQLNYSTHSTQKTKMFGK